MERTNKCYEEHSPQNESPGEAEGGTFGAFHEVVRADDVGDRPQDKRQTLLPIFIGSQLLSRTYPGFRIRLHPGLLLCRPLRGLICEKFSLSVEPKFNNWAANQSECKLRYQPLHAQPAIRHPGTCFSSKR
jgi:hypothetical protein